MNWECDFCGDVRSREQVNRIHNTVLWERDVLTFCNDRDCEARYKNDDEVDHHRTCDWCGDTINTIIQANLTINGKNYHKPCWKRKVRTIEETHNTNPPTWC